MIAFDKINIKVLILKKIWLLDSNVSFWWNLRSHGFFGINNLWQKVLNIWPSFMSFIVSEAIWEKLNVDIHDIIIGFRNMQLKDHRLILFGVVNNIRVLIDIFIFIVGVKVFGNIVFTENSKNLLFCCKELFFKIKT